MERDAPPWNDESFIVALSPALPRERGRELYSLSLSERAGERDCS